MRLRDVVKLRNGDVVTCRECSALGCDGLPAKVYIEGYRDTLEFYHERNPNPIATLSANGMPHWGGRMDTDQPISGRTLKLVKRGGE